MYSVLYMYMLTANTGVWHILVANTGVWHILASVDVTFSNY